MVMSPAETFNWIRDAIHRLFQTPIAAWTWGQWLLAFILLSLVSSCCGGGCLCCRRSRRRRYGYGYYGRSNSVGGGGNGHGHGQRRSHRDDEASDGYYAYRSSTGDWGPTTTPGTGTGTTTKKRGGVGASVPAGSTPPQPSSVQDPSRTASATPYRLAEDEV